MQKYLITLLCALIVISINYAFTQQVQSNKNKTTAVIEFATGEKPLQLEIPVSFVNEGSWSSITERQKQNRPITHITLDLSRYPERENKTRYSVGTTPLKEYNKAIRIDLWSSPRLHSSEGLAKYIYGNTKDGEYLGIINAGTSFHSFSAMGSAYDTYLVPIVDKASRTQFIKCDRIQVSDYICDPQRSYTSSDAIAANKHDKSLSNEQKNHVAYVPATSFFTIIRCDSDRSFTNKKRPNTPCVIISEYKGRFTYELMLPKTRLAEWKTIQKEAERLIGSLITE